MRRMVQRCVCGGIIAGLLVGPQLAGTARADYLEETDIRAGSGAPNYLEDAGIGTATVAANVLYIPTKLGYALLGGLTGGVAYVLTGANYQVAERVWKPSMGGNYILNRDHLRGTERISFSAPTSPE